MVKTKATPTRDVVKTTVDLPVALWRRAKIAAVDGRTDLRIVVVRALEAYLKKEGSR